ncbi:prealbumin-like fold domain-containing protein [Enterococcus mundtii]|nr:prealbumin-like fold domain-containing protein [Enterococcus mundtii]
MLEKRARDAITLTSDRNGLFSINGLADGEYLLEEIKAPKGYKRNPYAVSFVVKVCHMPSMDNLVNL